MLTKMSSEQPIDPWHYTGSTKFHANDEAAQFMKHCISHLPQLILPITINRTGYVVLNGSNKSNGWCYDRVGRVVIAFDEFFMFQRYIHGDILVGTIDGDFYSEMTSQTMKDLTARISN